MDGYGVAVGVVGDYGGEEEDYADFLARKYGFGPLSKDDLESDGGAATKVQVTYREARRPTTATIGSHPPAARASMPSWQRLSRNRAAKRASVDFKTESHLSTMYHMHRRIAEMYSKSGLARGDEEPRAGTRGAAGGSGGPRPVTSYEPGTSRSQARSSRPATAPSSDVMRAPPMGRRADVGTAMRVHDVTPAAAADPIPPPPSYSKRRVQNTAAALKTAILDEIVANRIYEGQRLKVLFRSYLKLNASEAFFPTLQQVIQDLELELGVV